MENAVLEIGGMMERKKVGKCGKHEGIRGRQVGKRHRQVGRKGRQVGRSRKGCEKELDATLYLWSKEEEDERASSHFLPKPDHSQGASSFSSEAFFLS